MKKLYGISVQNLQCFYAGMEIIFNDGKVERKFFVSKVTKTDLYVCKYSLWNRIYFFFYRLIHKHKRFVIDLAKELSGEK
jgi:hypothetical protein